MDTIAVVWALGELLPLFLGFFIFRMHKGAKARALTGIAMVISFFTLPFALIQWGQYLSCSRGLPICLPVKEEYSLVSFTQWVIAYASSIFLMTTVAVKALANGRFGKTSMGHKGDMEARYSTNKGRLPPTMIEEMREAYKKCEPLLSTKAESATEEQIKRTFNEQFLLVAGFQKEDIEKMNLDEMSNEELQSLVRQKLAGMMSDNGSRQKVIPVGDVKSYIGQGFEYVASLPDGEAIVKMPF